MKNCLLFAVFLSLWWYYIDSKNVKKIMVRAKYQDKVLKKKFIKFQEFFLKICKQLGYNSCQINDKNLSFLMQFFKVAKLTQNSLIFKKFKRNSKCEINANYYYFIPKIIIVGKFLQFLFFPGVLKYVIFDFCSRFSEKLLGNFF